MLKFKQQTQQVLQHNELVKQRNTINNLLAKRCPSCNIKTNNPLCIKCTYHQTAFPNRQEFLQIIQHILSQKFPHIQPTNPLLFQPQTKTIYSKLSAPIKRTIDNPTYQTLITSPCTICKNPSNGIHFLDNQHQSCCKTCKILTTHIPDTQKFYRHLANIYKTQVLNEPPNTNEVDDDFDEELAPLPTYTPRKPPSTPRKLTELLRSPKESKQKPLIINGKIIEPLTKEDMQRLQQPTEQIKPITIDPNKILAGEFNNEYSINELLGVADESQLFALRDELFTPDEKPKPQNSNNRTNGRYRK
jgi:hypothetical protein